MKDAANGYLTIAENMDKPDVVGQAFNLSTGNRYTVLDIASRVLAAVGRPDLTPIILNQAKAEIHDQTLSSAKAARLLSWSPKYTVDEGLAETVAWYRAYFSHSPSEAAGRVEGLVSSPSGEALMS